MDPQPVDVCRLDAARSFHAAGLTLDESLALAGLQDDVAAEWMKDPKVRLVLRQARAKAKVELLNDIANAEDDETPADRWRRIAWLLDYLRHSENAEAKGQTSPLPATTPKKEL